MEFTTVELLQAYKGINEAFNAEFVEEVKIEELDRIIKEEFSSVIGSEESTALINSIGQEVANVTDSLQNALQLAKIKDAEFLEKEMKSMIVSSRRVLETLEKDIKMGANARTYEVYGGLVGAITGQFKELRNLNESMAKFVLENKKQNLEEIKEDHKMMLSSNDALDMYMQAKNSSQLNAINADFDIVDDEAL